MHPPALKRKSGCNWKKNAHLQSPLITIRPSSILRSPPSVSNRAILTPSRGEKHGLMDVIRMEDNMREARWGA